MATSAPVEKFRKDYKLPDYFIHTVDLTFKIFSGHTQVRIPSPFSLNLNPCGELWIFQVLSNLKVKRRSGVQPNSPLILDAEDLILNKVSIDGKDLTSR